MKRFKKKPELSFVVIPGVGRVDGDRILEGDEFAKFCPSLLVELPPQATAVAPAEVPAPRKAPPPPPAPAPVAAPPEEPPAPPAPPPEVLVPPAPEPVAVVAEVGVAAEISIPAEEKVPEKEPEEADVAPVAPTPTPKPVRPSGGPRSNGPGKKPPPRK